MQAALEKAGVEFIAENGGGAGVHPASAERQRGFHLAILRLLRLNWLRFLGILL
jgi:hypothetical protein